MRLRYTNILLSKECKTCLLAVAVSATIGCSGSSDSASNEQVQSDTQNSSTIQGTAAIGAALANEQVSAECIDGSGFISPVFTSANGRFEGQVAEGAFPCVLSVSYRGEAVNLHSVAQTAGITNITPLTDLIIARASGLLPEDWNASSERAEIVDQLATAERELLQALTDAGFVVPSNNFSPLRDRFTIGDAADVLLDDIMESIESDVNLSNYKALLTLVKDGSFSLAPVESDAPNPEPVPDPSPVGKADSAACFPDNPLAVGRYIESEYRDSSGQIHLSIDEVVQRTTYKGEPVIEQWNTKFFPNNGGVRYDYNISYIKENVAPNMYGIVATIGESAEEDVNGNYRLVGVRSTTEVNPYITTFQTNMDVGDVRSQTYTTSTTIANISLADDIELPVGPIVQTATTSTRFVGFDMVTVPAGTFETCRFDTASEGNITSVWMVKGKSATAQTMVNGVVVEQLVSSTEL